MENQRSAWSNHFIFTRTLLTNPKINLMITPLILLMTSVVPPSASEALLSEATLQAAIPDWIHFYGDIRVRAESTMDQNVEGDDRTRGRLRFRAGAKFNISDELRAEVRMTTSSGVGNNVHWDFGGGDPDSTNGADVAIDRINLTWSASDSTTVKVGKFGNPFKTNPVFGEWTWDGDIQPAGVFGQWSSEGELDMDLRLGHFIIDEVNPGGDTLPGETADPAVTSLQLNLAGGEDLKWGFSTMVSDWSSEAALVWDSVASATSGDFTGSVEFIQNLDDDSGEDTGMAIGFTYGTAGSQGDSRFFGSYFDFDANAFVSEVAQDDTPLAGTGGGMNGFFGGWQYWWRDTVSFKVWGLQADGQADGDSVDPLRLRFDIDVNLSH